MLVSSLWSIVEAGRSGRAIGGDVPVRPFVLLWVSFGLASAPDVIEAVFCTPVKPSQDKKEKRENVRIYVCIRIATLSYPTAASRRVCHLTHPCPQPPPPVGGGGTLPPKRGRARPSPPPRGGGEGPLLSVTQPRAQPLCRLPIHPQLPVMASPLHAARSRRVHLSLAAPLPLWLFHMCREVCCAC